MSGPLLKACDVRLRLGGISRTTLWDWRRRRGFPDPIELSPNVHVWTAESVDAWVAAQQATPGERADV